MNQPNRQTAPRKPSKVVRHIGGYELLARLGEGGCGTVFKAKQPGLERFVALKILSLQLSKQPEYIKRFRNEARAAASINHLNVVQVLNAGFDDKVQLPYIVYEYIDGVTLTKLVEERGPLPEKEALAVVKAMAEALGILSEKGLTHRDVKPDNILINRAGIPKLTDLGLAKQESDWENITQTGIVMGTPDYMAPEQATGSKDLDLATDYYALGLTLYVMLTAQLPYSGDTLVEILTQHIQKDCPNPQVVCPWVSNETAKLVAAMTRRPQAERYNNAAALVRDITLANSGKAILGPQAKVTKRPLKTPPATAKRRKFANPRKDSKLNSSSQNLTTSQVTRRRGPDSSSDLVTADPLNMSGARDSRRGPARREEAFLKDYFIAFMVGGLLALVIIGIPRFIKVSQANENTNTTTEDDR
ncbi:MAG: serine/threonine-protein kinase [Planctomycetota bacterium]|nr:serine/threonine-protein kinase [Planctomycetota bacterium]